MEHVLSYLVSLAFVFRSMFWKWSVSITTGQMVDGDWSLSLKNMSYDVSFGIIYSARLT